MHCFDFFRYYQNFTTFNTRYYINVFFDYVVTSAVPMFFMISGILFFNSKKEETFLHIFKHRIVKYIVYILCIEMIEYVSKDIYFSFDKFSFKTYSKLILQGANSIRISWFLYAYIAFLIFLPLIKKVINIFNDKDFKYLFIIIIAYISFKFLYKIVLETKGIFFSNHALFSRLNFFEYHIFLYPIIGYRFYSKKLNAKEILIFNIINIFIFVLFCICGFEKAVFQHVVNNMFLMFNSLTIFLTLKFIFSNVLISDKYKKIFITFGKATFGIYIIHIAVIYGLKNVQKLFFDLIDKPFPVFIVGFFYSLIVFLISFLIVEVILFIKKIITNKKTL